MVEQMTMGKGNSIQAVKSVEPVLLHAAVGEVSVAYPTGVGEVDRVLGGGLVPGSVTLLGGEPGIGKSTLVLQLCDGLAKQNLTCLVVTGEESAEQVGLRARRLGIKNDSISVLAESDVATIIAVVERTAPDVLIVDSVQTMAAAGIGASTGSMSQIREVAQTFTSMAKARRMATLLIGHVTKEGALAGPRVLEHIVDTVLEFEGDRHQGLRFIRAVKHRFGATDEVGVLSMMSEGLVSVSDASGMFLDDRRPGTEGSVVVPVLQGRRPMLVEIQCLVDTTSQLPMPRRVAQGMDNARFALTIAVLANRAGFRLQTFDVFASVVGGIRLDDPGADLGVALAMASSGGSTAIPSDVIAIGEIGLGGEVRKVPQIEKRLAEAGRMGFKRALVPVGTSPIDGIKITPIDTLYKAIQKLEITYPPPPNIRKPAGQE